MKTVVPVFVALLLAIPVPTLAMYYGGYSSPPGFFWPYGTGPGAPREVITVHSWGPTNPPAYHTMHAPAPQYRNYNPQPHATSFYPSQGYYPYPAGANYGYQNYFPTYSYVPAPSYGYHPQPIGGSDLFGRPLCNWGPDYRGYPCDQDPHQWIYDPYTGTWY